MRTIVILLTLFAALSTAAAAQNRALTQQQILDRLAQLERQNRQIMDQIQELRQMLDTPAPAAAPTAAATAEKLDTLSERTADLDQVKVEASQKLPISLTGLVLFNAYTNGRHSGGFDYPLTASAANSGRTVGATVTQSIIGFRFGPSQSFLGARVTADADLDLWGGSAATFYGIVRLRTAAIHLDWKSTTLTVGQEKPLISPLDPTSFAQVAVPPLGGAGNLWNWQPQIRLEQRVSLGSQVLVKLQGSLIQTNQRFGYTGYLFRAERVRPGLQARVAVSAPGDQPRWSFGAGVHGSQSHVSGFSVPSRIYSADGTARLAPWLSASGTYYTGKNVDVLGGSGPSVNYFSSRDFIPVRSQGGWVQLTPHLTKSFDLNLFAGQQRGNSRDLLSGQVQNNGTFGFNAIYRIAPNVVLSWETSQTRTRYVQTFNRLNVHHDLAIAYLF